MPNPILTQTEAARLHAASLAVLSRTGVQVGHPEVRDLLLAAGAHQDPEGRILIPAHLVEEALEKARASSAHIQLYSRDGEPAIVLEAGPTYFGTGSDALQIRDLQSGEIRPAVLHDVGVNATIADAVGYDFLMTMGLPDMEQVYPHVYAELIRHSTRPAVVTGVSPADMENTFHIAEIVAGGPEQLRAKPRLVAYVEPISPLQLDYEGMAKLLFMAEHEHPFLFAAGANCGATAPITVEGGVVQANAEFLAGMTIALLKNERARVISGANTSSMDMRTTVTGYGAPEWAKTVAMYAALGEYYGLASWGTAGCSDATLPDFQAGVEAYESILLALQARSTLVHDMAYLKYGFLYDARMIVLSRMLVDRARKLLSPPAFTPAALAVDVIDDVARERPGADNYPMHEHTYTHFRQALWMPPDYWERGQEHTLTLPERLDQVVQDILSTHKVPPLSPEKDAAISQFLASL